MKKKTMKKRAHKLYNSLSLSKDNKTIAVGKPLYGREIKTLVSAANALHPLEGLEDILKFATFNPSRKYILDLNRDSRAISIIRYSDAGPDGLSWTYLELLNRERRDRNMIRNEKKNEFLEALDEWERRVFGREDTDTDGVRILYHPCLEPQQWVEVPAVYPELTSNGKFMERWNEFVSRANGLKPHLVSIEPILTKDGARACLDYSQAVTRLRNFMYQLKA